MDFLYFGGFANWGAPADRANLLLGVNWAVRLRGVVEHVPVSRVGVASTVRHSDSARDIARDAAGCRNLVKTH